MVNVVSLPLKCVILLVQYENHQCKLSILQVIEKKFPGIVIENKYLL